MGQPGLRVAEAPGPVLERGPDLTRVWKPAEVPPGDIRGRHLRSFPPQRQWLAEGTFYIPPAPRFYVRHRFTSGAWLYVRCLALHQVPGFRQVLGFTSSVRFLYRVPYFTSGAQSHISGPGFNSEALVLRLRPPFLWMPPGDTGLTLVVPQWYIFAPFKTTV